MTDEAAREKLPEWARNLLFGALAQFEREIIWDRPWGAGCGEGPGPQRRTALEAERRPGAGRPRLV